MCNFLWHLTLSFYRTFIAPTLFTIYVFVNFLSFLILKKMFQTKKLLSSFKQNLFQIKKNWSKKIL
jgi:hypothetical protein